MIEVVVNRYWLIRITVNINKFRVYCLDKRGSVN